MKTKIKINSKSIILFVLVLSLLSAVLVGILMTSHVSTLEKKLNEYLLQQQYRGSVLIAQEDQIIFLRGYGIANEEHQIGNSPKTVFHIGSITKLFTAVAILQLQEKGLLNVHDSINKYLPYANGDRIYPSSPKSFVRNPKHY